VSLSVQAAFEGGLGPVGSSLKSPAATYKS